MEDQHLTQELEFSDQPLLDLEHEQILRRRVRMRVLIGSLLCLAGAGISVVLLSGLHHGPNVNKTVGQAVAAPVSLTALAENSTNYTQQVQSTTVESTTVQNTTVQSTTVQSTTVQSITAQRTTTQKPEVRSWKPHFLDTYPLARCNDGSPAAYYYRPGDPQQHKWLIFLEGAGWCWDEESCTQPWHKTSWSSVNFPRTQQAIEQWGYSLQGILADIPENPLRTMHMAYVRTCSNDAFMGNRGPLTDTPIPGRAWFFRGKAIIDAVFTDLRTQYGLGTDSSDKIIYGGCSSGGRGAMVSLDYVAEKYSGKGTVRGLLDSSVWVPIVPLAPEATSFSQQTIKFLNFTNATTFLGDSCETNYAGEPDELWKCLMGSFRLPFIKTPYFLTHSQYDLFSISMNALGHYSPFIHLNEDQKKYAESYRHMLLKYLPTPPANSGMTVYSSACYTHCSVSSHVFFAIQADGVKLHSVLDQWIDADSNDLATGNLIDKCEGFDCGVRGASRTRETEDGDLEIESSNEGHFGGWWSSMLSWGR